MKVSPEVVKGETINVIDGDMISFRVASACEDSKIVAIHKASGNKKEFKNRTEFKGRSKKTIGGWLGDLNKGREDKGQLTFTLEDFEIDDVYSSGPIENALYSVKNKIKSIEEHLGGRSHLVLGEGKNFRHELPLPMLYKFNRLDTHKPELLGQIRDYMENVCKGEVVKGIEADDVLSMYQFKGHVDKLENGFYSYRTVAQDKDARQTDGELFNPTTDSNGKWTYPESLIIDGLGSLYLNDKGDVKGHGRAWLYFQIMNGDDTDGYNPTKPFKIRCGDKTVYKHLKECTTDKEYLEKLVEAYHGWFPEGVEYESHCGKEMKITPIEYMQLIGTCAYMLRWEGDKFDVFNLLNQEGVTY